MQVTGSFRDLLLEPLLARHRPSAIERLAALTDPDLADRVRYYDQLRETLDQVTALTDLADEVHKLIAASEAAAPRWSVMVEC